MTSRLNNPNTDADIALYDCLDKKISFVMTAGAGSGKTSSLIKGLGYIAQKYGPILRKRQQKIACITYTTVAENEILSDVSGDPLFHVSTIHSFLWQLISPFQQDIKSWVKNRINEKILELENIKLNFGPRVIQRTKDKNQADIDKYTGLSTDINSVKDFKYENGSDYSKGILGHDDIIKMVPQLIIDKPLLKTIIINKYPFFFVDESQDTLKDVVNSLISIDEFANNSFCLGFFGDPMQKIYATGIGNIPIGENWKLIVKPENFRCPKSVLDVINNIRKAGDGLQQIGGRKVKVENDLQLVQGSSALFILPTDNERDQNIEKVRKFIAQKNGDNYWLSNSKDSDLKILVIEHRMAAKRLDFENLYSIFKDSGNDSVSISFSEGKHWATQPFQKFLLPLVNALNQNKQFEVMELLRQYCPSLQKDFLNQNKSKSAEILSSIKIATDGLKELLSPKSDKTVRQIFEYVEEKRLMVLDERISARLNNLPVIEDENTIVVNTVIKSYFETLANQLLGYQIYIDDESVYSTQHSIKGTQFQRVLVIVDDEEGANSFLYSYEKLLGLKDLTKTDNDNIAEGRDSVLDRTRRLLYVCCSRATQDLAVIAFVNDVNSAYDSLKAANIFEEENVYSIKDLI